ncbi:TRIM3 [Branchiostoma lanceolatum]|uniref:TRIM3 protein n=1 Tax=Branchiostoma lanceolatum TaxID=7740 RepID=A0A8K0E3H5_BRALA|nr:TRIM3 [Branchiostoma lanceolatum]
MSTATLTSLSTAVGTAVTSTATEESETEISCPNKTDNSDTELKQSVPHKIHGDVSKTILEAAAPGSLIQHFIDEHLVCRIHNGFFHILAHIPRILACGHTFCKPCLRKIRLWDAVILCPVCGRVTGLPPGGVDGLPEDFYTASLCVRVIDLLEEDSVKLHADVPCITTRTETAENMSLTTSSVPENLDCEYFISEVDSFVVIDKIPPKENPSDGHVDQSGPVSGGANPPRLTIINGHQANPEAKQPTRTSTKRRLKRRRKKGFRSLPSILDKFMGDTDGHTKFGTQNHIIDSFNMPWV